jgi:putative holliday junction resolvase
MYSMNAPLPTAGRIAGIDFGTVRIGIALTDVEQRLASPYEIYQRRSVTLDARYFVEFAQQDRLVGWVVGLPTHLDGNESSKSQQVRSFAKWLHELTKLPIAFQDERYTSVEADQLLREMGLKASERKKQLDKLAAQLLLNAFLETRNDPSHTDNNNAANQSL